MVSLVDFINSVSYTDNIQDVSTRSRTVGRKVTFDRRGGSSDRSDRLWLRAWPTTPFCSRAVTISSHTSDKYNQTGRQTDSDGSGCESGWTGKTETYHKIYLMLAISQLFYTRFDRVATSPSKFPCNLTMSRYPLSQCIPQTPT